VDLRLWGSRAVGRPAGVLSGVSASGDAGVGHPLSGRGLACGLGRKRPRALLAAGLGERWDGPGV